MKVLKKLHTQIDKRKFDEQAFSDFHIDQRYSDQEDCLPRSNQKRKRSVDLVLAYLDTQFFKDQFEPYLFINSLELFTLQQKQINRKLKRSKKNSKRHEQEITKIQEDRLDKSESQSQIVEIQNSLQLTDNCQNENKNEKQITILSHQLNEYHKVPLLNQAKNIKWTTLLDEPSQNQASARKEKRQKAAKMIYFGKYLDSNENSINIQSPRLNKTNRIVPSINSSLRNIEILNQPLPKLNKDSLRSQASQSTSQSRKQVLQKNEKNLISLQENKFDIKQQIKSSCEDPKNPESFRLDEQIMSQLQQNYNTEILSFKPKIQNQLNITQHLAQPPPQNSSLKDPKIIGSSVYILQNEQHSYYQDFNNSTQRSKTPITFASLKPIKEIKARSQKNNSALNKFTQGTIQPQIKRIPKPMSQQQSPTRITNAQISSEDAVQFTHLMIKKYQEKQKSKREQNDEAIKKDLNQSAPVSPSQTSMMNNRRNIIEKTLQLQQCYENALTQFRAKISKRPQSLLRSQQNTQYSQLPASLNTQIPQQIPLNKQSNSIQSQNFNIPPSPSGFTSTKSRKFCNNVNLLQGSQHQVSQFTFSDDLSTTNQQSINKKQNQQISPTSFQSKQNSSMSQQNSTLNFVNDQSNKQTLNININPIILQISSKKNLNSVNFQQQVQALAKRNNDGNNIFIKQMMNIGPKKFAHSQNNSPKEQQKQSQQNSFEPQKRNIRQQFANTTHQNYFQQNKKLHSENNSPYQSQVPLFKPNPQTTQFVNQQQKRRQTFLITNQSKEENDSTGVRIGKINRKRFSSIEQFDNKKIATTNQISDTLNDSSYEGKNQTLKYTNYI